MTADVRKQVFDAFSNRSFQGLAGTRMSSRWGPGSHGVSTTSSRCDQFDAVADLDAACPSDSGVQTELSAKAANDITENAGILLCRLGIVGRHDATAAEISETDLRFGQPQNRARPRSLSHTFDAADNQIGAQASDVAAEHRHRPVGTNEQGQNVEPLWAVESFQSCAGPNCRLDELADLTRAPWQSVHQRLSVDAERRVKWQEARERSRGDDPALPIIDLHDTIAHQSRFGQLRRSHALAGHRLHRISPDRCHGHHWLCRIG